MKKIIIFVISVFLMVSLAACSLGSPAVQTSGSSFFETNTVEVATAVPRTQDNTTIQNIQSSGGLVEETSVSDSDTTLITQMLAENQKSHAEASDYEWASADVVSIELQGGTISASGEGVQINGSTATITEAGTYSLSGSLSDGQILVNSFDEDGVVRLILNGVDITSSNSAPIYISNADKVVLILAEGTTNTLTDGVSYVFSDPAVDEPKAALYSASDLTISGSGSLVVNGNYNDGISSKDGLVIAGGSLTVNAGDDGIRGKDYVIVQGGEITITAQGDGMKSDNEEEAERGYISVENGSLTINAGGDALQAATDLTIASGEFNLTAGGGSNQRISSDASAKAVKGSVSLVIAGGSFVINSADDALHSNGRLVVNGGSFTISSGDDAVHADVSLEINAGEILIDQSYEGLESAVITINDGNIQITSSDDGINISTGNDGSGMGFQGGPGDGQGGGPGGGPGMGQNGNSYEYTGSEYLYVNGGYIAVNAGGDGVDSNGGIEMTGGVLLVNGPTENMNGPLDFASFKITGGLLVASGSAGMAQVPGTISSQPSVLIYFTSTLPAGTLVHIQNSAGEDILTYQPVKEYQSLAFSSPDLVQGETYQVYVGGSTTGTMENSLVQGGTYTPGEQYESFTVQSMTTTVGSGGSRRRP